MAYTPINWQTGDTITAEKLNRCDNGWSVENTSSQLFSETVTTAEADGLYVAALAYATQITADTLIVTVNGTEYTCSKFRDENSFGPLSYYGGFGSNGPDFTEYPFFIVAPDEDPNMFVTTAEGTYTVVAVGASETVETSDEFVVAVNNSVNIDVSTLPMECVSGTTTYTQMNNAFTAGRILFFKHPRQTYMYFISGFDSRSISFYPTNSSLTVSWSDDVFTVATT